jgi:hypothetical protein
MILSSKEITLMKILSWSAQKVRLNINIIPQELSNLKIWFKPNSQSQNIHLNMMLVQVKYKFFKKFLSSPSVAPQEKKTKILSYLCNSHCLYKSFLLINLAMNMNLTVIKKPQNRLFSTLIIKMIHTRPFQPIWMMMISSICTVARVALQVVELENLN